MSFLSAGGGWTSHSPSHSTSSLLKSVSSSVETNLFCEDSSCTLAPSTKRYSGRIPFESSQPWSGISTFPFGSMSSSSNWKSPSCQKRSWHTTFSILFLVIFSRASLLIEPNSYNISGIDFAGSFFPAYAQYLENIRKGNVLKPSDKTHLNANPFGIITILPELRVLPFCPRLPVEPLYYYE